MMCGFSFVVYSNLGLLLIPIFGGLALYPVFCLSFVLCVFVLCVLMTFLVIEEWCTLVLVDVISSSLSRFDIGDYFVLVFVLN